jgi:hypothetical protein
VGNETDLFAGPETPGTATVNQDRAAGTGRGAEADTGLRAARRREGYPTTVGARTRDGKPQFLVDAGDSDALTVTAGRRPARTGRSGYKTVAAHEFVNHEAGEYVWGNVSTNLAEGYFSQFSARSTGRVVTSAPSTCPLPGAVRLPELQLRGDGLAADAPPPWAAWWVGDAVQAAGGPARLPKGGVRVVVPRAANDN